MTDADVMPTQFARVPLAHALSSRSRSPPLSPSRCTSALRCAVEPFVLKDIRVEGLQRTDAGTVFAALPFRIGDTYTDEKGSAALRALFATGLFKDVRIDIDNGVAVVIVEERAGHRQHRLRRHEGVREGRAVKSLKDFGIGEGLPFDKALADRAEQELKRQYLTQEPVRRRGRDDGDAAGAQPRQRDLHGHRGRAGEDQRDPHRRQQGVLGAHAEGPVRAQRRRLAELVH